MTFTKEQLQQIIETDHVQCGDAAALARELLESRADAEPVGYYRLAEDGVSYYLSSPTEHRDGCIPLYTRPQPAPVVPQIMHSQGGTTVYADYYAIGWNACRAAMLQEGK